MSKFEQQKQELKNFIDENIAVSFADHVYIHEMINELQPERPTCATCKSFTQELSNAGSCKKGIGCDYIQFVDGVNPIVFIDFGCIHHSDYEKGQTNG